MPVVIPAPTTGPGPPPFGAGTWNVVLDPASVATGRAQFQLNSGPIRIDQKGIDWGDAAITAFMADLRIGSEAVDYRVPNRHPSIPLFLGADESGQEEEIRSQLQQKVGLLQREGGILMRQRAGGPAMYADIVNATLSIPDVYGETGWVEPNVVLNLETLPDFYGDEVDLDTQSATGVMHQVLTSASSSALIAGDTLGRMRIVIADTSGNVQRGGIWGLRSRYYDPSSTAELFYEAESMTAQNGAAVTAQSGASGGNVVRLASLAANQWTTVLTTDLPGTGSLTHRGTYQVWARCYSATATPQLRLQWSVGSLAAPISNQPTLLQGSGDFYLVNLGPIRVITTPTGTYAWTGAVQAFPAAGGDSVAIDALYFVPLDDGSGIMQINQNAVNDVVIAANGLCEARYDGMFRPSPATAPWGSVSTVLGDLPRIPPSGVERRVCEIFVKPSRGIPLPGQLNYVPNPSFDNDTAGQVPNIWTPSATTLNSGAVLTVASGQAQSGLQSMQVVTTSATNEQGAFCPCSLIPTFLGDVPYLLTIWLKGNAGGERIDLLLGGTDDSNATTNVALTTTWQQFTLQWTPSGDRLSSDHGVSVRTTASQAGQAVTFFVDTVVVVQGFVGAFADTGIDDFTVQVKYRPCFIHRP